MPALYSERRHYIVSKAFSYANIFKRIIWKTDKIIGKSKYFRFCQPLTNLPHILIVLVCVVSLQPFKNVKNNLNVWATQNQVIGSIWPGGHSLPTPDWNKGSASAHRHEETQESSENCFPVAVSTLHSSELPTCAEQFPAFFLLINFFIF